MVLAEYAYMVISIHAYRLEAVAAAAAPGDKRPRSADGADRKEDEDGGGDTSSDEEEEVLVGYRPAERRDWREVVDAVREALVVRTGTNSTIARAGGTVLETVGAVHGHPHVSVTLPEAAEGPSITQIQGSELKLLPNMGDLDQWFY